MPEDGPPTEVPDDDDDVDDDVDDDDDEEDDDDEPPAVEPGPSVVVVGPLAVVVGPLACWPDGAPAVVLETGPVVVVPVVAVGPVLPALSPS